MSASSKARVLPSYVLFSAPENPNVWSTRGAGQDSALQEIRLQIRRVLRLNAKKKLGGDKFRGRKWVQGKQAQCAIIGHLMEWATFDQACSLDERKQKCRVCGFESK